MAEGAAHELLEAIDALDLDVARELKRHPEHEKFLETCRIIHRTFHTPDGQKVLAWMVDGFLLQALDSFDGGGPAFREGQRDVVRQILINMKIARTQ